MYQRQKGLTLTELLTALAIVCILIAIMYPLAFAYIRKGRIYDAQQALLHNVRGLESYYSLHYQFKKNSTTWADLPVQKTDFFCIKMQGSPTSFNGDHYTMKAVAFNKEIEPRVLVINQDLRMMQCESSTSTCDEQSFFKAHSGRVDTGCVSL